MHLKCHISISAYYCQEFWITASEMMFSLSSVLVQYYYCVLNELIWNKKKLILDQQSVSEMFDNSKLVSSPPHQNGTLCRALSLARQH